jgi:hypothetical protein
VNKFVLLTCAVSGLLSPLFADSTAHEYYDRAAWEKAVANSGTLLKDNFDNNSISLPGVSVASSIGYIGLHAGSGHFSGGAWIDNIPKYGDTEWTFRQPVYAFGAHFRMDVQSGLQFFNGLHLSMPDAKLPYRSYWETRRFDGFYGFISRTPIKRLMITWGSDGPPCACYGQSYTMDNLEISTAPVLVSKP